MCYSSFGLDFTDFQRKLEILLERTWSKALSIDWFPEDKARSFSLEEFYVGLKWVEKKGALKIYKRKMKCIYDIFNVLGTTTNPRPIQIYISGKYY